MSDFTDDTDTDDDGTEYVRIPAEQAKQQRELARQAKTNADAATERDAAKRELAFLKAGVDTDTPVGKLFARGFDGDITVDAIKAAAAEIPGLIAETTTEPTAEEAAAAKAEAESTQLRQQLSQGGTNAGVTPDADPRTVANETIVNARQAGTANDKALSMGFDVLTAAALNGDKRVVIDTWGAKQ